MRKRLVLGHALAALVSGALSFAASALGLGSVASTVVGFVLFVTLASIHSIRVVNELLRAIAHVEEAVLRASHGETGLRLGAMEPPLDGLAFRLDEVFATLEANGEPGSIDASRDIDG